MILLPYITIDLKVTERGRPHITLKRFMQIRHTQTGNVTALKNGLPTKDDPPNLPFPQNVAKFSIPLKEIGVFLNLHSFLRAKLAIK